MFNKNLKTKRGFSLVELMVVVAIMGVLSAIAIPSYSEYRKTAKKNVYKTDLTSLHKAWLTFGIELDDFCSRDISPKNVNLKNVGMLSLFSSKFYGVKNDPDSDPTDHDPENGPGTPNFIGFGRAFGSNCNIDADFTGLSPILRSHAVRNASVNIINVSDDFRNTDGTCDLRVIEYKMAVYGHLSGDVNNGDYYGAQMQHTGVFKEVANLNSSLTNGDICS